MTAQKMMGMTVVLALAFGGCVKVKQRALPVETKSSEGKKTDTNKPQARVKTEEKTARPETPLPPSPDSTPAAPTDPAVEEVARRFQQGIRFLSKGKTEAARDIFEALRDGYPGVAVFYLNLGVIYKRLGRHTDAIGSYRKAIDLSKRNPDKEGAKAHYNLGILLREQGDFEGAEAAYLRAVALHTAFDDAHFNLAVLYDLYLNQADKAIHHYQRHMALNNEAPKEMEIWISALQKRQQKSGGRP